MHQFFENFCLKVNLTNPQKNVPSPTFAHFGQFDRQDSGRGGTRGNGGGLAIYGKASSASGSPRNSLGSLAILSVPSLTQLAASDLLHKRRLGTARFASSTLKPPGICSMRQGAGNRRDVMRASLLAPPTRVPSQERQAGATLGMIAVPMGPA